MTNRGAACRRSANIHDPYERRVVIAAYAMRNDENPKFF